MKGGKKREVRRGVGQEKSDRPTDAPRGTRGSRRCPPRVRSGRPSDPVQESNRSPTGVKSLSLRV